MIVRIAIPGSSDGAECTARVGNVPGDVEGSDCSRRRAGFYDDEDPQPASESAPSVTNRPTDQLSEVLKGSPGEGARERDAEARKRGNTSFLEFGSSTRAHDWIILPHLTRVRCYAAINGECLP